LEKRKSRLSNKNKNKNKKVSSHPIKTITNRMTALKKRKGKTDVF